MEFPADLRYSPDHLWVRESNENEVVVGITDFAQDQLGQIIYVELPEVGDGVEAGIEMGTLESAKSVSEVISPVNGEVVRINESLEDEPAIINQDPYGKGWMAVLKIQAEELDELLSLEQYKEEIS